MHSVMQFYSSFSFSCPAGLPQDCPARRERICRPFRGKGPSACSKGKTGACVLNRQRRAEPPESPGRHPAHRRFPPPKSRCAPGKTPPRRDRRSALRPSATLSRTKKQDAQPSFSARENVRRGSPPMFFPSPPIRFAAWPTACTSPAAGRCAAILRADAPCISALPEAQNKKKTMPKHRLFLFNTPENRRKHQSP